MQSDQLKSLIYLGNHKSTSKSYHNLIYHKKTANHLLPNNKSHGPNGFPVEFYRKF